MLPADVDAILRAEREEPRLYAYEKDRYALRLLALVIGGAFVVSSHPARSSEPFTLAWARLDLDPETGECLIEEVQSDWVTRAQYFANEAQDWLNDGKPAHLRVIDDLRASAPELLSYVERALRPYARIWQECVLMATLDLAYRELGVRTVYFHTYDGGLTMKRMAGRCEPPRSLYTDLPQRFCFQETERAPRILRHDKRLQATRVRWFTLSLI